MIKRTKTFEEIKARAAEIAAGYPEERVQILARLEKAQKAALAAHKAEEEAEDIDQYEKAVKATERAEREVKFAQKALRRLDTTPRMKESEYDEIVAACKKLADDAVAEYRKVADAAAQQIKEARDNCISVGAAINEALTALDESARVMQHRYPCKIKYCSDGKGGSYEAERIEDPFEWKNHAVRYPIDKMCELATKSDPESNRDAVLLATGNADAVLLTMWGAVARAYSRHSF